MDELNFAYFSMEFAVDPAIPTYSGGLGILAGDTIRTAADLGLHAVGVTLLHHKGYTRQHLDSNGNQSESDASWSPERFLQLLPPRVEVSVAGHQVQVQAWRYLVRGEFGHTVPVYFLDSSISENTAWDQTLTERLYGGDATYRLCQEVILGFAGVAMLRVLGYHSIRAYHMNEGHAALVTLALLEEQTWGQGLDALNLVHTKATSQHCVFTTHTPLTVGHDEFPIDIVREILGDERTNFLIATGYCNNDVLNMTNLALDFSRYVNGVSMRHQETASRNFPNHKIDAITNGVHAVTWTSPAFHRLYDNYIPQWRRDNLYLKYVLRIPVDEIWEAHTEAKKALLAEVKQRTGIRLNQEAMTLGFARRATQYKQHDLIFYDLERLRRIAQWVGPLQIIFGGKAHPEDEDGKIIIKRIFEAAKDLEDAIPIIYLEEYDIILAKYVCSGVDLWLRTPKRPQEASGTSGMKAALNGVPTFGILDGWWIEGHVEGVTGWSIGDSLCSEPSPENEATSIYDKLENIILPLFYQRKQDFMSIMRSTIALNGSYFNTQRMLTQYLHNAYR